MRARSWLCALVLLAACRPLNPCKKGTLWLSLTFDSVAQSADQLHIAVSVDGTTLGDDVSHRAGAGAGTVEVDFPKYPRGTLIPVAVTAFQQGRLVGSGGRVADASGACATLDLHIGAAVGAPDDLGASAATVAPTDAMTTAPAPGANGAACASAADCTSGFCVDGVCCDSACSGACEACDNPAGTCSPVTSGQPHGSRPACAATTTCGLKCTSASRTSCSFPANTTICQAQTCIAAGVQPAAYCDGAGSCGPTPNGTSCGLYACNALGTDCNSSCSGNGDCAPGDVCWQPAGLDPFCCAPACSGHTCGSDGCGGSCGTCTNGKVCDHTFNCCKPNCTGKACGSDDGCGGVCACPSPQVCDARSAPAVCCTPQCTGLVCGGDNGCGGRCPGKPCGQRCCGAATICCNASASQCCVPPLP
jgi:hypothetical protein